MTEKQKSPKDLEKILRSKLSGESLSSHDMSAPGDHIWKNIEEAIEPKRRRRGFWILPLGLLLGIMLGFSLYNPQENRPLDESIILDKEVAASDVIEQSSTEKLFSQKMNNEKSLQEDKIQEPTSASQNEALLGLPPKLGKELLVPSEIIEKSEHQPNSKSIIEIVHISEEDQREKIVNRSKERVVSFNQSKNVKTPDTSFPVENSEPNGTAELLPSSNLTNKSTPPKLEKHIDLLPIHYKIKEISPPPLLKNSSGPRSQKAVFRLEGGVSYGSLVASTQYNYVDENGGQSFKVNGQNVQTVFIKMSKSIAKKTSLGVGLSVSDVHFDGDYNLSSKYDANADVIGSNQYLVRAELPTYAGEASINLSLNKTAEIPADLQNIDVGLRLDHGIRLYDLSLHLAREIWSTQKWTANVEGFSGIVIRENNIDTPSGTISTTGLFYNSGSYEITGVSTSAYLKNHMFRFGLEASLAYRLSSNMEAGLLLRGSKMVSTTRNEAPSGGVLIRYLF